MSALTIIPRSHGEIQTVAESISKSNLLPDALKNKVPDLIFQIMTGAELGLAPIASIRGIHIIQGKPILSSDSMVALVMSSGACEYFMQVEATNTSVTYETKRKGAPRPQTCTWTMEDAKRAFLHTKDTWKNHPRQMLASRCRAELARSAYPDVLAGCYDPDEMDAQPVRADNRAPEPEAVDAEFIEQEPEVLGKVRAAESLRDLDALLPELKPLPKRWVEQARSAYKARKEELAKLAKEAAEWEASKQPEERVSEPAADEPLVADA